MNIGMLWFDNDKQSELKTKVKRAAEYYQKKYKKKPNVCFVNPAMLESSKNGNGEKALKISGVEIIEDQTQMINHFWIGVHDG